MERKLPAMMWYVGDWLRDPGVRSLGLAGRGLWADMLNWMWDSPRRGELRHASGLAIGATELARLEGVPVAEVEAGLAEMERVGVFSRADDGAIVCRRMVRDQGERDAMRVRQERHRAAGAPGERDDRTSRTVKGGKTHGDVTGEKRGCAADVTDESRACHGVVTQGSRESHGDVTIPPLDSPLISVSASTGGIDARLPSSAHGERDLGQTGSPEDPPGAKNLEKETEEGLGKEEEGRPPGTTDDRWRWACECARLVESAETGEAVADVGGTRRRRSFLGALDYLEDKGLADAWSIKRTLVALRLSNNEGPRKILRDLQRYPDGAYPRLSGNGKGPGRLEQAIRLAGMRKR